MADGGGSGDGGSGVVVAVGESPIRSHNLLTILFNRLIYSRGIKKKMLKVVMIMINHYPRLI